MTDLDIPIFVSGDSGSSITQYFNPPIVLNNKKKYVMRLINATMFFTFPNIYNTTTSDHNKNNTLQFSIGATQYNLTIPEGLYDISSLSNAISNLLVNNGLAANSIVLSGDAPTQRSIVQINNVNLSINWTNSLLRTVLGFNAGTIGPSISGTYYYSNNVARFNTLSELLVHASCCTNFRNNTGTISSNSDVVASVLINTGISSQIIYDPNQAINVEISQYVLDSVNFYVTDQENRSIINNEVWTLQFVISEWK